jgi:hypothetical protein
MLTVTAASAPGFSIEADQKASFLICTPMQLQYILKTQLLLIQFVKLIPSEVACEVVAGSYLPKLLLLIGCISKHKI